MVTYRVPERIDSKWLQTVELKKVYDKQPYNEDFECNLACDEDANGSTCAHRRLATVKTEIQVIQDTTHGNGTLVIILEVLVYGEDEVGLVGQLEEEYGITLC